MLFTNKESPLTWRVELEISLGKIFKQKIMEKRAKPYSMANPGRVSYDIWYDTHLWLK